MRALAFVATGVALLLLVAGSLVHQTGSSLACPDWPLCNGTAFPSMRGGILFEHSHRLIALTLVVLALALAFVARKDERMRTATLSAVVLVVVQAGLGAATVLLRLPAAVSIAHLATAMTLLATLAWIAARSTNRTMPLPSHRGALIFVIAQCTLGAFVRHSGAALACFGFPSCSGVLWPDALLARVHVVHRVVAFLVFGHVAATSVRAIRASRSWLSATPVVLASAQLALGIAMVRTGAPFALVTLHHATAASLVVSLALLVGITAEKTNRATEGWRRAGLAPWRGRETMDPAARRTP
jgi:heme A synthase